MSDFPGSDPQTRQPGVPEAVVDGSKLLTRPVYSALVAEISGDLGKLDELRLIARRRGVLSDEALRQEVGRVYGRHVTLLETLSIVEMLS
jgi:hypothetical protein